MQPNRPIPIAKRDEPKVKVAAPSPVLDLRVLLLGLLLVAGAVVASGM